MSESAYVDPLEPEPEYELSEDDKEWYDKAIPNNLVRNRAIEIHQTMSWKKIRNLLMDMESHGRGKAYKNGTKRNMAALAALDDTKATSMVAVCEDISGFDGPIRERDEDGNRSFNIPMPTGRECELFMNGRRTGHIRKIEGDTKSIRVDYQRNALQGAIRDSTSILLDQYDPPRRITGVSYYGGEFRIDGGEYSSGQSKVSGDLVINARHKTDLSASEEFLCRRGEDPGFECVNWVNFFTPEEAREIYGYNTDTETVII